MAEPNLLIPLPDEMAQLMKLTQWQAEQIERLRAEVLGQIERGTFAYEATFPGSKRAVVVSATPRA
jgi:hypothetical protein